MTELVAVVGPTASGKTSFAIELAEALGTEIISADSMQFYRGMEIGTGTPSPEELTRVKHHFVSFLDPDQEMSAGRFQQEARAVVERLNRKGKIAVVVGGSGLYVRALIDGLFEGPGKSCEIRSKLKIDAESEGVDALYQRLQRVDPEYAKTILQNDLRRIVRALEVYETTGVPMSRLHREDRERVRTLNALQFGLNWPRETLYERIDERVDDMLEKGLIDEVKQLVKHEYETQITRLKSLGYREILAHIRGEICLEEAASEMKKLTRRYAKRQISWFRKDKRIEWLELGASATIAFHTEHIIKRLNAAVQIAPR